MTDEDVALIAQLQCLQTLHVGEVRLTGTGLQQLGVLKGLSTFTAIVPDEKQRQIQQALPDCRVLFR